MLRVHKDKFSVYFYTSFPRREYWTKTRRGWEAPLKSRRDKIGIAVNVIADRQNGDTPVGDPKELREFRAR